MASTGDKATEEPVAKGTSAVVALESNQPHHASIPLKNLFSLDLSLRALLFASTITALLVMVTSKETQLVLVPFLGVPVPQTAKFTHSPALIYFVAAMTVACFYSLVTVLISLNRFWKPCPTSAFLLLNYIILDVLMVGIVASATGSAGGVAYVGLRGNSHVGWTKICSVYGKLCRHVGSSIFISLFAAILLVYLVFLSAYSLYRNCRSQ